MICLIVANIFSAILVYGLTYGYFSGKYPHVKNYDAAIIMSLYTLVTLGPACLLMVLIFSNFGKYGLKYK